MAHGKILLQILAGVGALSLQGCATGGVFCSANHENPRVEAQMRDVCEGDRNAAMQLGLWFESQEEYEEAVRYYQVAASAHAGQTYIYVPPAGDVAGYVMPVDTGPRVPGNAEAQYRLGLMYRDGRGVRQNEKKARSYFARAAEQGHADAEAILKTDVR
ncbi:MAG: SEL1-like repeat protein [Alphaproteobacteria bacterium]|nr:SEL1-like repeat protein [Alphaproteobacteria bacterium]